MECRNFKYYNELFGISKDVVELSKVVESEISQLFSDVDEIREANQLKVIWAMQKNRLSDTHFAGTTGYGYDDTGRDLLDKIYAMVFGTEDALVRHNIVCGTHAITLALLGNLSSGDEVLSVTGKPYDTLDEAIGLKGNNSQSLISTGVKFKILDLLNDGMVDYEGINKSINSKTKMIFIQRSKGYSTRKTLSVDEIGQIASFVKNLKNDIIVFVDNCYGEFVEKNEPTNVGANLIAGSLIKNPGGGISPCGGYVAGDKALVKKAAERLTCPGIGKKVGASLGFNRLFFQGLFLAPHIVAESVKGAIYAASMMEKAGFCVRPCWNESRGDIIESVEFGNEKLLTVFCQAIQKAAPVDSFVKPEAWDMPGYDSKVIMAAGAFIQGSSIELSADAPIRPPYMAYMQGGLVYEHVKLGIMTAISEMIKLHGLKI